MEGLEFFLGCGWVIFVLNIMVGILLMRGILCVSVFIRIVFWFLICIVNSCIKISKNLFLVNLYLCNYNICNDVISKVLVISVEVYRVWICYLDIILILILRVMFVRYCLFILKICLVK